MDHESGELRPWSPSDSVALYRMEDWGLGYFGISPRGTVEVYPDTDPSKKMDLLDIVQGLEARDICPPVILRFSGILDHRMREIRRCFDELRLHWRRAGGLSFRMRCCTIAKDLFPRRRVCSPCPCCFLRNPAIPTPSLRRRPG